MRSWRFPAHLVAVYHTHAIYLCSRLIPCKIIVASTAATALAATITTMSSRTPTAAAASDDDNLDLVSSLQQEFADLVASPSEETYAPSSTERQSTNNVFLDGGESESKCFMS